MAHGPSCSAACGIFPDQGSNPCPLHWQADSQPLRHQGSPGGCFLCSEQTKASPRPSFLPLSVLSPHDVHPPPSHPTRGSSLTPSIPSLPWPTVATWSLPHDRIVPHPRYRDSLLICPRPPSIFHTLCGHLLKSLPCWKPSSKGPLAPG